EANDGVLDLKLAAYTLVVRQKWRIYDIINMLEEDIQNSCLAYMTHEDICRCFAGNTLLGIWAPSGTRLEVPIPEGLNGQKKYQIHLKSMSGPNDVLLVNKEAWSSLPVAVFIPPPEDLLQSPLAVSTQSPPAVSTPPPLPKPALALNPKKLLIHAFPN
ncbi:transcription factor E2F4 isoform X2, partial [Sigmodon hispidus]